VPQPAPVSTQLQNIGSVSNKGLEATIDANLLQRGRNTWTSGLVFTMERNEVTDLGVGREFIATGNVSGQGQSGQNSQRLLKGEPIGTFFGPEYVGVNAQGVQEFNKYDASGNKSGTTTAPSAADFRVLGNANPTFALGWRNQVNYGKFDAQVLVRASVGGKTFNNTALVYATKGNALQNKNFIKSALDDGVAIDQPSIYSSRWLESASFVRVQNLTVGYTFTMPRQGRRDNARFYLSGDNLLLLTGYSGYDPEVFAAAGLASRGIDYLSYPRARTFTTGVKITY
jgi:TonB-dependent starch-binding outer membrane protein SusC